MFSHTSFNYRFKDKDLYRWYYSQNAIWCAFKHYILHVPVDIHRNERSFSLPKVKYTSLNLSHLFNALNNFLMLKDKMNGFMCLVWTLKLHNIFGDRVKKQEISSQWELFFPIPVSHRSSLFRRYRRNFDLLFENTAMEKVRLLMCKSLAWSLRGIIIMLQCV